MRQEIRLEMPISKSEKIDGLLCVGVISGVHGIKGDVKIKTFTQIAEDISTYGTLLDKNGKVLFGIDKYRITPKALIVTLSGVNDRNKAESLKGTKLYILKQTLPETQEDEFYYSDLSGLKVIAQDGSLFGTVQSIQNFGAGDLVEIVPTTEKDKTAETVFFNFTQEIFPTINVKEGIITIAPPQTIEDSDQDQADFLKQQQ